MNYLKTHPWITFQLDLTDAPVRFWTLLGDANAKCEFISGIPLMPEVAKRLNAVSLEKGARATTAIEGNTLSEEEVSLLARGKLDLPPSKEYLAQEVSNILVVFNEMIGLDEPRTYKLPERQDTGRPRTGRRRSARRNTRSLGRGCAIQRGACEQLRILAPPAL